MTTECPYYRQRANCSIGHDASREGGGGDDDVDAVDCEDYDDDDGVDGDVVGGPMRDLLVSHASRAETKMSTIVVSLPIHYE